MRTDEDFLRLEAENRLLKETLSAGPEIAAELKRTLVEFLAPRPQRTPPEVQIALRVLASVAGVPSLCDRRECRRKGACLAEDDPPWCHEHWSKNLSARFADIATGIQISEASRQQEEADFHAWACEQMGLAPDGTPGRKAPRRKQKKGLRSRGNPSP